MKEKQKGFCNGIPRTTRLWDSETRDKLDKDRFCRDIGGAEEAYAAVMKQLCDHI